MSLTLRYLYDENRSPVGFGLKYPAETGWTNYYFAKNLQGDVTAIYRSDASGGSYTGTLVAKYAYDPFGQVLSVTNASGTAISATAANVANYNPFRYRGYYYDTESGFYYLQSRYYDPEICRFINADKYASTGQGFLGCNMFAYCNNNPINIEDSTGKYPTYATASADSGSNSRSNNKKDRINIYTGLIDLGNGLWYDTTFNKHGELYEHWYDSNQKEIWSRHYSDHGNPKQHPMNPHDHAWKEDDDGNNTPGPGMPPNPQFQVPNNQNNNNELQMVGELVGGAAVGYIVYVGVKWLVAVVAAPATGGASLVVAGATP